MDVVKIRRQGNSLSVTLDQVANLRDGDLVAPSVQKGVVILTAVEIRPKVRPQVPQVGRKVIAGNRRVLDRLAKNDTGQVAAGRRYVNITRLEGEAIAETVAGRRIA